MYQYVQEERKMKSTLEESSKLDETRLECVNLSDFVD